MDGKTIKKYAQFGEKYDDHLATIGIVCHELGHLMFSLPDLYDTDKDNGDSYGVGAFDLMGDGSWGAASEGNPGSSPTLLSSWSKECLSWGTVNPITSSQTVSFPKADGNSSSIFRINTSDSNQYFLIENRQFTGYDTGFQRHTDASGHGGLVIYHIDKLKTDLWFKKNKNKVNADEDNKGVDVEEANEGSLGHSMLDTYEKGADTNMFFFQGNNTDFTDTTTPSSKLKKDISTNISITDISTYGDTMTAMVTIPVTGNTTPTPSTTVTPSPTPTPTTTTQPTPSPEVTPESTPTPTPTTSNSFTLAFPLSGKTAYTATISSVFDHSMSSSYCPYNGVIAYTDERGTVSGSYVASIKDCNNDGSKDPLYGFKKLDGSPFRINGYYAYTDTLYYDGHPGYDYPVPIGTDVFAAADGVVIASGGDSGGLGEYIKIEHRNGYHTLYGHLSSRLVSTGQNVTSIQLIGKSGNTGSASTGPHLHFEVRKNVNGVYVPVDPYGWEGTETDPYKYAEHNVNLWETTSSTDNPPSVSITSPASGTTVSGTVTVTANATDDNGIKKVEFYLDGSLKSTSTSSPYSWSWDSTQSTNTSHTIKVVAYDTADQTATSQINITVSNSSTTFVPTITSINPTGGGAGASVTINGTKFGTTQGTVKFGTAIATVTSWSDTKIVATAPAGSGTVNVTVTTTAGTSNGVPFAYSLSITVTIISPNGGETWQSGTTQTIKWSYTGNPGSSVNIQLLKGESFNGTITSGASLGSSGSGSYSWMIPSSQTVGGDYKIKVISNSYADTSDSNFTISASKSDLVIQNLSVIPSSGSAGSSTTVRFTIYNQGNGTANSSTTNIRINSSSSSVSTSDTLLASISIPSISSGGTSYANQSVTIPTSLSAGTYYIWVMVDVNNTANQSDTSNDKTKTSFTISGGSPTVTVTSPNGGESWSAGSTYTISWSVTGDTSNINYFWTAYSTDGGSSFTNIVTASSSDRSLSWTIPSSVSSTQCKVRVRALDASGYILAYDISDSNFTISSVSSGPTVTVTSPNGGESWSAGSTYTISWSVTGDTSNINYFWTAYSTDGGSSFTSISTASSSDRSLSWTIPSSVSSTQCKVRVRALDASGNILAYDISNSNFTITGGGSTQTERITNGSFSSGTSGWTLSGDFWAGTNLSNYRTLPGYAAGGVDSSGAAKNSANGSMYQSVTIPSNATSATLSFWYNITSNETSSGYYDTLNVTVQNSSGSYLATVAVLGNNDKGSLGSYSQKSLDVTSYKGQTIRIYFLATTDSSNYTVFRIDDVSLMSDGN